MSEGGDGRCNVRASVLFLAVIRFALSINGISLSTVVSNIIYINTITNTSAVDMCISLFKSVFIRPN